MRPTRLAVLLLAFTTSLFAASPGIAAPAAPTAATPTAPAGKLITALAPDLVTLKGTDFVKAPAENLGGIRFVALYFSAHWCPPCRRFTPELVAAHKEIKAAHPDFEVIFISSDRSEKDMKGYMEQTGMTWLAVSYDKKNSSPATTRPDYENGIPNLVFMSADGREISTSFDKSGAYVGPQKVLQDIRNHFKR